ncbi:MAG: hypothetical protein Ct9H300mP28_27510 [Pseudomonadota bacterium]|nr:MAG: hypothetical protein Ct9H300mP28_27510 [Pseudomonadota bacterium]
MKTGNVEPLDQAESFYKHHMKACRFIPNFSFTKETVSTVESLWQKFPGKRIRFKHVRGGGKRAAVVSSIDEVACSNGCIDRIQSCRRG